MKELYLCPLAEVISFMPNQAIALEEPGWGWEDDIFGESTPEARNIDEDAERRDGYEG